MSNTAIATKTAAAPEKRKASFSEVINSPQNRQAIANTLQDPALQKRYISSIVTVVANSPALQRCTFASILSASLLGESLKLSHSPQLGHYYMIPFEDKKNGTTVATFVLGYHGMIQLALRSGYYKRLNVLPLKQGELLSFDPLTEDIEVEIITDAAVREATPTIGYVATFEYLNGFRKTIYWSKEKMLAHADRYSAAFSKDGCDIKSRYGTKHKVSFADYEAGNYPKSDEWMYSSFWYKDFDGMAQKTLLRQLISKWGIMSIEMQEAISRDANGEEKTESTIDFDIVDDIEEPTPAVEVDPATGEVVPQPSQEDVLSMDDLDD